MSATLLTSLRGRFEQCARSSCEIQDCKLKLSGFPGGIIIIDVDCAVKSRRQGRRCDFAAVVADSDGTFFLPIEFKSGNLDFAKIKEQLEGGIKFFQRYLPNNFKCYPLIVSKRKLDSHSRKKLSKIRVVWNGRKTTIRYAKCNESLSWRNVKKN